MGFFQSKGSKSYQSGDKNYAIKSDSSGHHVEKQTRSMVPTPGSGRIVVALTPSRMLSMRSNLILGQAK